jgi:hypothetical protein
MSEAAKLLEAVLRCERLAAAELLPLNYDELRKIAAAKIAHERPGQTLRPPRWLPLTQNWIGKSFVHAICGPYLQRRGNKL